MPAERSCEALSRTEERSLHGLQSPPRNRTKRNSEQSPGAHPLVGRERGVGDGRRLRKCCGGELEGAFGCSAAGGHASGGPEGNRGRARGGRCRDSVIGGGHRTS